MTKIQEEIALHEVHEDLFNNLWMRGYRGDTIIEMTRTGLAARGLNEEEIDELTPDHRDLSVWMDFAGSDLEWDEGIEARWQEYAKERGLKIVDLGYPAVNVYQPSTGKLAEGYTLTEIWNCWSFSRL